MDLKPQHNCPSEKLGAKILCPGHYVIFTEEDAIAHIENSLHVVTDYLIMTEKFLVQEKGEVEKVVEL
ncbi:MAG: hypothetical protein GY797_21280 [Deltaproteobacteria bacterium]|nr:hypothetical protein [Deltaproteobacteria bacterium]